jgi:hypothetical protein
LFGSKVLDLNANANWRASCRKLFAFTVEILNFRTEWSSWKRLTACEQHLVSAYWILCVREGKFTESLEAFDHPLRDWVRNNASAKAAEIRQQGFSGPAKLPRSELEYGRVKDGPFGQAPHDTL